MNPTQMPPLDSPPHEGELTWDIARLFPRQGNWSEAEYLALETNHLVELSKGRLEFLPMPTLFHQFILQFLFKCMDEFVTTRQLGFVAMAPVPVRLAPGEMREPDLLFLRSGKVVNPHKPPNGADLVAEVVSPGAENRKRDLEGKRADYAAAGISEYWIVDPQERYITVLVLDGQIYREHGTFLPGTQATSVLLAGFAVDVAEVFSAGEKLS